METKEAINGAPTFDAAFDQLKDLSDQFVTIGRKTGSAYVDSYEKAVDRAIELELQFAGLTKQEWLKATIQAQADVARELVRLQTSTARSLLK